MSDGHLIEALVADGVEQALVAIEKAENFEAAGVAAETTPWSTALRPGQSPPLVRTPILLADIHSI